MGLATNNEQLAALTAQPLIRIRRLRRIVKAPKLLKDAIEVGCSVPSGRGEEGPAHERRHLELMAALQFLALYEHLKRETPKHAEARTEARDASLAGPEMEPSADRVLR